MFVKYPVVNRGTQLSGMNSRLSVLRFHLSLSWGGGQGQVRLRVLCSSVHLRGHMSVFNAPSCRCPVPASTASSTDSVTPIGVMVCWLGPGRKTGCQMGVCV